VAGAVELGGRSVGVERYLGLEEKNSLRVKVVWDGVGGVEKGGCSPACPRIGKEGYYNDLQSRI